MEFEAAVRDFLRIFPARIDEYEALLTKNPLFLDRTRKIGVLIAAKMPCAGVSPARCCAPPAWPTDLRKVQPYSGYEQYDFEVPTRTDGDIYARYLVRMEEMRQSLRIVQQALDKLPFGPVRSNNRKYVPPPRSELGISMEAVIHHFKLWTEGFPAPKGSVYAAGRSRRAASWVSTWKAMAAPSPTVSTGARLRLSTCRSCRCCPRVTWWPTWSA